MAPFDVWLVAELRPVVHHCSTLIFVEVSIMSEEKKTPEEVEVDEEQLEEVAGGIGTWPTPERTLKSTPKTTEPLDKQMEPLDKKLTEPIDRDTLNR